MRNTPGVPLTIAELQLSSPLPSPNRHSVHNSQIQRTHHHTRFNHNNHSTLNPASISTSSSSNSLVLPPLHFDPPFSLNPDLYPLATTSTPDAIKRFSFEANGKTNLFEEVQVMYSITQTISTKN